MQSSETHTHCISHAGTLVPPGPLRLWSWGSLLTPFSPIERIPDLLPALWYLDDLIIVPLGVLLAIQSVPAPVMAECRERAAIQMEGPTNRTAAAITVGIWLLGAAIVFYLLFDVLNVV